MLHNGYNFFTTVHLHSKLYIPVLENKNLNFIYVFKIF